MVCTGVAIMELSLLLPLAQCIETCPCGDLTDTN